MTPSQQEQLFAAVRKARPYRPVRWASGYVHGVADQELDRPPNSAYLCLRFRARYPYGWGYFLGYADAVMGSIVPVGHVY